MTNQPVRCPKCDQPLTEVGEFWICPQHGQVSLEKTFAPLRIFLSYGHDNNEELVRRIRLTRSYSTRRPKNPKKRRPGKLEA